MTDITGFTWLSYGRRILPIWFDDLLVPPFNFSNNKVMKRDLLFLATFCAIFVKIFQILILGFKPITFALMLGFVVHESQHLTVQEP